MSRLVQILVILVALGLPTHSLSVCARTPFSFDQNDYSWEQFVEDYQQYVAEAEEESDNYAERYDWLEELKQIHENPIDINTAEREDLLSFHFLSDEQVDSLLAKRDRYHGFRSLGELLTVRELGYRERSWLSLFITFGRHEQSGRGVGSASSASQLQGTQNFRRPRQHSGQRLWRDGSHEVTMSADIPLYKRAGFYKYDESNYATKMFLGSNFSHLIKYQYQFGSQLKYGISLQQDYGERFAAYGAKPWDFSSLYFYYKAPVTRKPSMTTGRSPFTVVAGDYKLQLGQGLIVGGSTWGTTLGLLTGSQREAVHLRPHTGTDESHFLRGAAGSVRLGNQLQWELTGFVSCRQLDGTVKGASSQNDFDKNSSDTITAWKTDGLHRTFQEVAKRGVATQMLMGGRVGLDGSRYSVGLNGAYAHYSKMYWPAYRQYNAYYLRGDRAAALSLDYFFHWKRASILGEFAYDPIKDNVHPSTVDNSEEIKSKGFPYAWITALRWQPLRTLSLALEMHSFSKAFITPYGKGSYGGNAFQNEESVHFGGTFRGWKKCEISGSFSYAYLPRPAYLADTCSYRFSASLGVLCHGGKNWQHSLRYKLQNRQQNVSGYDGTLLEWRSSQHLRWQSSRTFSRWSLNVGSDLSLYHSQVVSYDKEGNKSGGLSKGGLLYARCTMHQMKRLTLSAFLAGFLTDNYYARCYAYLPQLRGAVSIPSFYGKGVATCSTVDWRIWHQLFFSARFSLVRYFDRDAISSSLNLIEKNYKADLTFQLRLRL